MLSKYKTCRINCSNTGRSFSICCSSCTFPSSVVHYCCHQQEYPSIPIFLRKILNICLITDINIKIVVAFRSN
uniref:Ovule protein n=1 Tax=Meloidogyne incognita TaxID=6306 RepID=A0A914LMW9_MELIC